MLSKKAGQLKGGKKRMACLGSTMLSLLGTDVEDWPPACQYRPRLALNLVQHRSNYRLDKFTKKAGILCTVQVGSTAIAHNRKNP